MSKTSQQQRRSKEKKVSEWGEQDGQALRVLDTHGLLGEKCHHSGLPKVKGRGGRFWGSASIPPGDHSGAKAKGNMTDESTCHPWHPLLPGCPPSFPVFPGCLPEGPNSKPDTFFWLVSVLMSTKSRYPCCLVITSWDHIISLVGPGSGDGSGQLESCAWWLHRMAKGKLPPSFSQLGPYHNAHSLEDWLQSLWSFKECLSNSAYIVWVFSWLQ